MAIFLPKKINVGFVNRQGTYTGKLAYVIYYDEKGKLRKEKSWNSWRDEKIPNQELENEPTSGFVLNKKAGGYSTGWNHRQTYVRIYDPRGFEFEITVPNLLYILENTNSIKGKGLEGEFVYGWSGQDLLLMPVDSPDYKELKKYNEKLATAKRYVGKDMKIGATYLTKDNTQLVYMGRFYKNNGIRKEKKEYFFCNLKYSSESYYRFKSFSSVGSAIIETISEECVDNYAELMDELMQHVEYSERDSKKDEYIDCSISDIENFGKYRYGNDDLFGTYDDERVVIYIRKESTGWYMYGKSTGRYDVYIVPRKYSHDHVYTGTPQQILDKFKPQYLVTYKSNGEKIKEWKASEK